MGNTTTEDEDGFEGVADAGLLALGIDDDVGGHLQIGIGVDIDVADAVVVLDDGHAGAGDDFFDQTFAAAWDDEIEVLIHLGHVLDAGAVGEGDELDAVVRKPGSFATGLQSGG